MLLIFFKKLTRPKFVAYRVLLIKDTECSCKTFTTTDDYTSAARELFVLCGLKSHLGGKGEVTDI